MSEIKKEEVVLPSLAPEKKRKGSTYIPLKEKKRRKKK